MKEYDLKQLLEDKDVLNKKIQEFILKKILLEQSPERNEVQGHLLKSEHNLRFVQEAIKIGFFDWALVGCYYACYHAALSLIMTKGYTSKNHLATLCVLIKEFYKKELTQEDIETLSKFLDYQDVLFYVESKEKRERAAYTSKTNFSKTEVEELRLKAHLFVAKIKSLLEN